MENLQKRDPFILLSWVNTKLRDQYGNLQDLCLSEAIDKEELIKKLQQVGYRYDDSNNQFTNI